MMQTIYLTATKNDDTKGWFGKRKQGKLYQQYYKRKCRHCGYEMNFYVHKKKLCRVCNNYIYPDDKEEFREILKEKRKENNAKSK